MTPSVSVIIPSFNSHATISKTLDSLLKDPDPLLREVLLVDSSDDGRTRIEIEKHRSPLLSVRYLSKKTIPATARNMGAREARGEILAFIDSDAYAAEGWFTEIVKAAQNGCRAGGGALLLPHFQQWKMIAMAQYFLQFNEFILAGKTRPKMFVPSCNLFCDKTLFEKAGGFPEIRACEDVLLGIKINQIEPVHFVPEVKIYHIFREEWGSYLKNQVLLGRYILIYRRFYSERMIYQGIFPVLLLPLFLAVKFTRITWRVISSGQGVMMLKYVISLPFFLMGFFAWGVGFFKACFETNSEEGARLRSFADKGAV